jgi:hemoglobin
MFDRWLSLWAEVTEELLPPDAAVAVQRKADRIAESLKLALYFRLPSTPKSLSVPAVTSS